MWYTTWLSWFADDTKLYARVNNDNDREMFQNDINKVQEWSDIWNLKFNLDKCKHLHLGDQNKKFTYKIGNTEIISVTEEKDLGVIINNKSTFQKHISTSVKKANQKLGVIHRMFKNLDKEMFLPLYKSLVRPPPGIWFERVECNF